MKNQGTRPVQPGTETLRQGGAAPGARELPDALLDLVVGGAGDPTVDLMARLVDDGVLPPGRGPRHAG